MATEPASNGPLWFTAIGLALVGVMLMAFLAPRLFGLEETSWWVTVAVGVVIGALVVIVGYAKRGSVETEVKRPEE